MPDKIEMLFDQAVSALDARRFSDAERICRQVLKKRRKHLNALSMMAYISMTRLALREAESYLKQCITLSPREPYLHEQLAKIYTAQGRFKEAISRYDRILALQRGHTGAIAGKAAAMERRGDGENAFSLLEPLVAAGDETPEMAITFATLLSRERRYEEAAALAMKHLGRPDVDPESRVALFALLGKTHERTGSIDDAFEAYRKGNAVHGATFDVDRFVRTRNELIDAFGRESLERLPRAATDSALPVFIVGTARSGTTMLDRIIDAHPKGIGIGETEMIRDLANGIADDIGSARPYPQCIHDLTQQQIDRASKSLLGVFKRRACGAQRVADKSISNFNHLGLISLLFPQAAIIHIQREPIDACFSIFVEPLETSLHPYSNDLRNIGIYHREYRRLMEHWRTQAGIRMLEVRYEDLVTDPERWIRAIIEFCGLEWDDACLRFHESGRAATTFSYDQVRQPIYRTSVGRAEPFRKHLRPLIEALGNP